MDSAQNKEKLAQTNEEQNNEVQEELINEENLIKISKDEYEKLLLVKEESEKKLLYAMADFDNCKKRLSKETEDKIRYANERIILEIIPVIDNLILAMEHAKTHNSAQDGSIDKFFEGVDMIIDQFYNTLSKYGVEKINSVGEKFDPQLHEAMDQKTSDQYKTGDVTQEYQQGYKLNGKTIRCSKVCVCKNEDEKNN